jgi:hypothetical protein
VAQVKITLITPAAAARPCALSTPAAGVAAPADVDSWRNRVPATGMRLDSIRVNHNSIAPMGVAPVNAGFGVYGAAKQVAPPRGVFR